MNSVNKTLYIPLYGKAYVSRRGLFLHDSMAESIWQRAGFPLKGKAASKWLAFYMGIRAAVFDDWVRRQLAQWEDAVVLHLGCGLDARVTRVAQGQRWYDVDFESVITERRRYFQESGEYRMLAADVSREGWLEQIGGGDTAVVVMEGISMYLTPQALQELFAALEKRFSRVAVLMDCYSGFAARMSRYKNPINQVGVTKVYGLDDPGLVQHGALRFYKEHDMTPGVYADQLQGVEKTVFRKLYAGKTSRKLYRLYEYRKEAENGA